jgi:hypothetical protein
VGDIGGVEVPMENQQFLGEGEKAHDGMRG